MSTAAELGISEQDFQDAMIMERLYAVRRKVGRCSKCSNTPTHVDCETFQFLCGSHASGRSNCKQIGVDRFSTFEVERLERRSGGGDAGAGKSSGKIRQSRHDRGRLRKPHRSASRRKRSPSYSDEEDSESDADDDYVPPPSRSKSRSRSQPATPRDDFDSFDIDFGSVPNSSPNNLAGMVGILANQQRQGISQPQMQMMPAAAAQYGMGVPNGSMSRYGSMVQSQPGRNPMGAYGAGMRAPAQMMGRGFQPTRLGVPRQAGQLGQMQMGQMGQMGLMGQQNSMAMMQQNRRGLYGQVMSGGGSSNPFAGGGGGRFGSTYGYGTSMGQAQSSQMGPGGQLGMMQQRFGRPAGSLQPARLRGNAGWGAQAFGTGGAMNPYGMSQMSQGGGAFGSQFNTFTGGLRTSNLNAVNNTGSDWFDTADGGQAFNTVSGASSRSTPQRSMFQNMQSVPSFPSPNNQDWWS